MTNHSYKELINLFFYTKKIHWKYVKEHGQKISYKHKFEKLIRLSKINTMQPANHV